MIVDAEIDCGACGNVGVIRTCRPSFLRSDLGSGWAPPGLAEQSIDLGNVPAQHGTWLQHSGNGLIATEVGSCLTAETTTAGIVVTLGTHTWGGRAQVSVDNTGAELDLYSADPTIVRVVLDRTTDAPASRWSIVLAPGTHPRRGGDQAIVHRVAELIPASSATPPLFEPFNRGNPYPPRFAEILAELPSDAVVVDVGGGDRRFPDRRVLNFEYLKFDGPDFFGDGLELPLADSSVDFILSQAVLEHVAEPQRAVDELRRVLKPNGRIYAEFAFMQPLHAVPYHFFNITPHGADLLFRDWAVEAIGTFGGLAQTVAWFFGLLDAGAKLGVDTSNRVIADLAELDRRLTPEELDFVASAVFVEARPGLALDRAVAHDG